MVSTDLYYTQPVRAEQRGVKLEEVETGYGLGPKTTGFVVPRFRLSATCPLSAKIREPTGQLG